MRRCRSSTMHPYIDSISPTSGGFVGGTLVNVSGVGFENGAHYVCAFGGVVVGASFVEEYGVISCVSPAAALGAAASGTAVAVEVSLNAQQFSSQGRLFMYHESPTVLSYSPTSGPREGGTFIQISVTVSRMAQITDVVLTAVESATLRGAATRAW